MTERLQGTSNMNRLSALSAPDGIRAAANAIQTDSAIADDVITMIFTCRGSFYHLSPSFLEGIK